MEEEGKGDPRLAIHKKCGWGLHRNKRGWKDTRHLMDAENVYTNIQMVGDGNLQLELKEWTICWRKKISASLQSNWQN